MVVGAKNEIILNLDNFKLNFDSKTYILDLSEEENAVKMGINEKRSACFVKKLIKKDTLFVLILMKQKRMP